MQSHEAYAAWTGDPRSGEGSVQSGSGALAGSFDGELGSSPRGFDATPEEILGAAHAASFTLELAEILSEAGHAVDSLQTRVEVWVANPSEGGPSISRIIVHTVGSVPGIDAAQFEAYAESARARSAHYFTLSATPTRVHSELQRC
jgi:osmotically inducible protein OsmC